MLDERTLEEVLAQAGLSAPVRFEEVTRSTNETALLMAGEGAPEWTLVAAGHQTAGRGRLGRSWVDEPGSALMFSIVLRPQLPADLLGLLSLLAGTAAAHAARDAGAADAGCKWPNDIVVAGGKAGGVLAEATIAGDRVRHVVIGVGINIGAVPAGVEGAASLGDADPGALLASFLRFYRHKYQPAHPAFAGAVIAGYREVCETLGTVVRATAVDGGQIEGRAVDLDETGGLLVETAAGRVVVAFGDVEHLRA